MLVSALFIRNRFAFNIPNMRFELAPFNEWSTEVDHPVLLLSH